MNCFELSFFHWLSEESNTRDLNSHAAIVCVDSGVALWVCTAHPRSIVKKIFVQNSEKHPINGARENQTQLVSHKGPSVTRETPPKLNWTWKYQQKPVYSDWAPKPYIHYRSHNSVSKRTSKLLASSNLLAIPINHFAQRQGSTQWLFLSFLLIFGVFVPSFEWCSDIYDAIVEVETV